MFEAVKTRLVETGVPEGAITLEEKSVVVSTRDRFGRGSIVLRKLNYDDHKHDAVRQSDEFGVFVYHERGSVLAPKALAPDLDEITEDMIAICTNKRADIASS